VAEVASVRSGSRCRSTKRRHAPGSRARDRSALVLRRSGGGPSKKRGLREGVWTLSTEQINATCELIKDGPG